MHAVTGGAGAAQAGKNAGIFFQKNGEGSTGEGEASKVSRKVVKNRQRRPLSPWAAAGSRHHHFTPALRPLLAVVPQVGLQAGREREQWATCISTGPPLQLTPPALMHSRLLPAAMTPSSSQPPALTRHTSSQLRSQSTQDCRSPFWCSSMACNTLQAAAGEGVSLCTSPDGGGGAGRTSGRFSPAAARSLLGVAAGQVHQVLVLATCHVPVPSQLHNRGGRGGGTARSAGRNREFCDTALQQMHARAPAPLSAQPHRIGAAAHVLPVGCGGAREQRGQAVGARDGAAASVQPTSNHPHATLSRPPSQRLARLPRYYSLRGRVLEGSSASMPRKPLRPARSPAMVARAMTLSYCIRCTWAAGKWRSQAATLGP